MAKRVQKQLPDKVSAADKAKGIRALTIARSARLAEAEAARLRKEEALLEKLGTIFGDSNKKAADMARRGMSRMNDPKRRIVFLVALIKDFSKLKRVRIVRHTPLIEILGFQFEAGASRGPAGESAALDDLDRIERRRTEPIYVYRPKARLASNKR